MRTDRQTKRDGDGRKDRQDEANSSLSQFRERAEKWHKISWSMKLLTVSERFVVI